MPDLTSRQAAIMAKLRAAIAEVGEACGESSPAHLDLREVANDLAWYFGNRATEARP